MVDDSGFMKRALSALLAFFVVGSTLGQSPAKVRITTWNLEWFPNGSPHDATLEKQVQRIQAAADVLKKLNPDIFLLQEVRDYDACARLGDPASFRACFVALHDLRLDLRTFVRLPLHRLNGTNGMSDLEGKVARVGASERGQRKSFKIGCCNFYKGLFLMAAWRWVDRKEEARQNHQNPEAPLRFACLYKTQL